MVTLQVRLLHVIVTSFHKINNLFIYINIVGEPKWQDPKALCEFFIKKFPTSAQFYNPKNNEG